MQKQSDAPPLKLQQTVEDSSLNVESPLRQLAFKMAELFKMDAILEGQLSRGQNNRPNIQGLSRQVKQEVSALKCLGLTLVTLGFIYTIVSIVNLTTLSAASFEKSDDSLWPEQELFTFVKHLNILKVAHGVLIILLTICIAFLTTRNKVTTKQRYSKLIILTLILQVSFLIPSVYDTIQALSLKNKIEAQLFSNWIVNLVSNSNVNTLNMYWNWIIVIAIYCVSVTMQLLTFALRSSIRELETLRDKVHFDLILDQTAYEEFDDEDDEEDDIELQESKVAKN